MNTQSQKLLTAALGLPETERAGLAASLLRSLDAPEDLGSEAAWTAEIERRIQEIDDGTVDLVPWQELVAKMQQRR